MNRAILALTLLLVNVPVSGQSATPSGDLGQASGWLALSAEQRGRTERLTNLFRKNGAGAGRTLALRTRVRADLGRRSGLLQGLVEIQDARSTLTDEPFLVPALHTNELDLLQLQVRVGADDIRGGDLDSEVRFGRFTLDLGRRRLVARNRMRNTTTAFDGAVWRLESPERWRLHILASRPVLIDPEALDSSHGTGAFWGSYYEQTLTHRWGYDVYALVVREPADAVLARRHVTLGGRLASRPSPGRVDIEVESAWQTGTVLARDHTAHFQHGEVGYTWAQAWTPRLSLHYDYASGRADAEDSDAGAFDTLFGARRFEYGPTGIFGPFFRGNLQTPGARLGLSPHTRVEVTTMSRGFWLADAGDRWLGTALVDPAGQSGSFVGTLFEVETRVSLVDVLSFEAGYAHLFKGRFADSAPGSPGTPDSQYFYAGWEVLLPDSR